MLDGRSSILLGSAFSLALTACGGSGDIGAVPADETAPTAIEMPETVDEPVTAPTTDPTVDSTPEVSDLGACAAPNAPPRCEADPQTFNNYGVAGVITSLELLADSSCCADFNGDGEADNALGRGMADIDRLDALNDELRDSLIAGTQTILLELEGVDDAENDEAVQLHVYGGQRVDSSPASGPEVALDPTTIDEGVAPLFTFDHAVIEDGRLVATQGRMELEASFNGVLLKPVVHDIQLSAQITDLANGLTLRDGEFAGRLALTQLHSEINAVAAGCDCLGLDTNLISSGTCGKPDVAACEAEGRETCAAVVEVCPVLEIIASNIADVDADGDGTLESISLGALFEADAARIMGVMN